MNKFKVWDELNGEEEHAADVEAPDAELAAEGYADDDTDGQCDGIYGDGGARMTTQPIMVRCLETQKSASLAKDQP